MPFGHMCDPIVGQSRQQVRWTTRWFQKVKKCSARGGGRLQRRRQQLAGLPVAQTTAGEYRWVVSPQLLSPG